MARSQYKNCIIFASGELNQLNGQWKPIVSIFWKNTTQKCHSISDLPGSFETENESIACAFQAGKDWIDSQSPVRAADALKNTPRRSHKSGGTYTVPLNQK